MKTLVSPKIKISDDGKSGSMTFDIVEKQYPQFPCQRHTVGYLNPDNMGHARHIQATESFIFVKAYGVVFGISSDDLISIATAVEPKTSFAPVIKELTPENLTVQVGSELTPDFQWQISEDAFPIAKIPNPRPPSGTKLVAPIAVWTNIKGQTKATLDPKTVKRGQWVRCVASSEAGSMTSNPAQIK